MANQATSIIFKITTAGKKAALQAGGEVPKVKIELSEVAVGSGKYTPNGQEVALKGEVQRSSIVSGDIETASNTLRFSSSMTADTVIPVYELGLFTTEGVLFAIAASSTTPLFTIYPNITFVGAFGLSLNEAAAANITVVTDPNGALAITLMQQHLAAPDPHPQYLNARRFTDFLELAYPYGHPYWTHSKSNPKPLFDAMFGYETHWRRLEGVGLVAVKDGDTYIGQPMLTLGQVGNTEPTTTGRPHAYPIYTSYLFERYNPADVIETVWRVTANKTAINEGSTVRFTVTANNLPDGQILNWSAKEGALNSSSNDITNPDKTGSGTVILRNGQAVIDFTTTPDDNVVEPQKHVRLTVGAPANLSINIPITDAGHNETAIHIKQSTNEGISLDEYYKQQSGAYPAATDKIRFIVDAGVDIIAPNTSTPAMVEGNNWPVGAQIVVENRGRILGHGGDGGNGAAMMRNDSHTRSAYIPDNSVPKKFNATAGTNGGTAIKGNIKVENYGVIAGGGGGGGGSGSYLAGFIGNWTTEHAADFYHTSVDKDGNDVNSYAGSGVGAGGAPFGNNGMATLGFDWLKNTYPDIAGDVDALIAGIESIQSSRGHEVNSLFLGNGENISQRASLVDPYDDENTNSNLAYLGSHIAAIRNKFGLNDNRAFVYLKPITAINPENYNPKYETERYRYYSSQHSVAAIDSGIQTTVGAPKLALAQPIKASLTDGGLGGALSVDVLNSSGRNFPSGGWRDATGGWVIATEALNCVRGGNGGAYGEKGEDGRLDKISYNPTNAGSSVKTINFPIDFETHIEVLPPAAGGLAGYTKEGSVTITNFGSGTTKGR